MAEAAATIRVLIADSQVLYREGLSLLLRTIAEMAVVAEAGTSSEAVDLAGSLCPDVVLLGLELRDHDHQEKSIRLMKSRSPLTKILVLSADDDPDLVRGALNAGAHGYVTKNVTSSELIAAINAVQRDDGLGVVSVSRDSLTRYGHTPDGPLTPREAEVLRLAALALTNTQIASRLGIAPSTVKRHLTNAYSRLGAESRIDAINKAVAFGLIR